MKSKEYTALIKEMPDKKDRIMAHLLLDIRNQLVISALKSGETATAVDGEKTLVI